MKILCIVDNFPPEVNALASRMYEHAVEWVKAGHQVTVVTCCPNFPSGKPFAGYENKLYQKENIGGIEVIRVWSYMAPNKGFFKRILDFMSFSIMSFFISLPIQCDVVLTSSPQFFVNFSGLFLKIFKRKTWYMEVRDLWPESIAALNFMKKGILYRILSGFELAFYTFCDNIIVVTNSFKEKIITRGISKSKIKVIPNGINQELYSPRPKDIQLLKDLKIPQDKTVIGYLGTLGEAQNLISLISFFKNHPQYFFLIVGDGAQRQQIQKIIEDESISNIILHSLVPKDATPRFYSIFDVGLIPLREVDAFKEVIPSKIFEIASMNVPILHIGSGESADIIRHYKLGTSIQSPTPNSIEKAITSLLSFKPQKKKELEENYGRKLLSQKFFN